MSRVIFLTTIVGAVIAGYWGMPWALVLAWGALGTCAMAAVETKSIEPLAYAAAPALMLFSPQIFDSLRPELRAGLTIVTSVGSALWAIYVRAGDDHGLGRTDPPEGACVAADEASGDDDAQKKLSPADARTII